MYLTNDKVDGENCHRNDLCWVKGVLWRTARSIRKLKFCKLIATKEEQAVHGHADCDLIIHLRWDDQMTSLQHRPITLATSLQHRPITLATSFRNKSHTNFKIISR